MQDTVEVIINKGGLTCTTVNPLDWAKGKLGFSDLAGDWLKNEFERKTYEIENIQCTSNNESGEVIEICLSPSRLFQENFRWVKIGSTHKAQIINNKAVIL